ncbi:Actin-binding Rho-activating protein [Portunus trituberculatus]|uniref:Actin-binding Rho-activating protein n=1 Tax=Portunus trituberculatus TaxID=210409 RepID=A0A5B7F7D7_PORTR|nr:Actin-binding Rho-activating protein [Portunus trituberculatus]
MPLDVRLFHSGVGSMKDMFNKKVEEHKQAQLENPFSEWEGAGRVRRLSKEDIGYGRPAPGSKSEQRSQLAKAHVMMEMRYLCDMIWDCAEWRCPDGRAAITFGKLFKRPAAARKQATACTVLNRGELLDTPWILEAQVTRYRPLQVLVGRSRGATPSVDPPPPVTGAPSSDLEQCNFAPAACPTSGCGRDPRPLRGLRLLLLHRSLPDGSLKDLRPSASRARRNHPR